MNSSYDVSGQPYPAPQIEALTRSLWDPAKPIFFLDSENNEAGWARSPEAAVADGRPFVVTPRKDVLALDDDSGQELAARFAEEYLADYEPVLEWTGQVGRQRCLVVVDDYRHRQWLQDAAQGFGIPDSRFARPVRPPGSPHRMGGWSRLIDLTPEEAIRRLARPHRSVGLGYRASQALYRGTDAYPQGRFASGGEEGDTSASRALWSATLGMVNAGYDETTMWSLLMAHPGGEKVQRKAANTSEEKARRWWERYELRRARDRVAASPLIASADEAHEFIDRLCRWMAAHRWSGVGGANQRAALTVMLAKADELNSTFDIGMSERQLAEQAGFTNRTTAGASLKKLIDLGVLEETPEHYRSRGTTHRGARAKSYTLRAPKAMTPAEHTAWYRGLDEPGSTSLLHQSEPGGVRLIGGVVTSLGHDAFRRKAIGKSKYFVWQELDPAEVRTTRQISEALRKSLDTTRKHLRDLEASGLALRASGGWLRLNGDLDGIALEQGTAGQGDAMHRRHQRERELNNSRLNAQPEREFVEQRITVGSLADTVEHVRLRSEFYDFCNVERRRTGVIYTPGPDVRLMSEILALVPGASFERSAGTNLLLKGRWRGLRVIASGATAGGEAVLAAWPE